ncbi:MAG: RNA polymerase recycling motor HelD [Cellulosilyticaceae bacterium]
MEATKHRDYEEEKKQLHDTKDWVHLQHEKLQGEDESLQKEIVRLKKEVSSAMDERLILKQQMQQMVDEDKDKMALIKDTPYFGRINFCEKYKDDMEVIYIGKFGLYDSEQGEMLVLDWRAPMAHIYYSGMDEEVAYRTPKGMVEGQMHLKRRYVIEEGELTEIHDEKSLQDRLKESIQGESDFLIESLHKTTKGRLKEIVATIQDQQNKIIRSDAHLPLVVQGVAGSGKTTIALHRMAYMIYNRQSDSAAKYMVVAPNKLFLHYIEEILPDLGVDNVFQTTFESFALSILGKKYKLYEEKDQLDTLLTGEEDEIKAIALSAKIRGSIALKKIIDLKLQGLEKSLLPKEHIQYEEMILISYKELMKIFLVSNKHLSLENRVKQLGDYLKKRLKDKENLIRQGMERAYGKRIEALKEGVEDIETIRPAIRQLYDERDAEIKSIKKWIPVCVKTYLSKIQIPTLIDFYLDLFDDPSLRDNFFSRYASQELQEVMFSRLKVRTGKGVVESEDLGPLVYSHMKLYGVKNKEKYTHIVVDEAQDLDEMKITVLREVSASDAFTFVGDLSQGIYDYKGITSWERMMERVFDGKRYHYYEMTTSYRSTIEIIGLANEVIGHSTGFTPVEAQAVLRHGDMPVGIQCQDEVSRLSHLVKQMDIFKEQGMHSICILTRGKEEAQEVSKKLREEGVALQCIEDQTAHYTGGVVIMPSYLSKGLEFDAVIIYDVSEASMTVEDVNLKLLYVMVTRALHKLFMYSIDKPLPILQASAYLEWQSAEK